MCICECSSDILSFYCPPVPPTNAATMGINCEGQINAISMNKDSSMVVVAGRSGKAPCSLFRLIG